MLFGLFWFEVEELESVQPVVAKRQAVIRRHTMKARSRVITAPLVGSETSSARGKKHRPSSA
jgi:hypothetical protein